MRQIHAILATIRLAPWRGQARIARAHRETLFQVARLLTGRKSPGQAPFLVDSFGLHDNLHKVVNLSGQLSSVMQSLGELAFL